MEQEGSLYEALGGAVVIAALVDDLYRRALANAKLAAHFAHAPLEQIKVHQRALLTHLLDGPSDTTGYALHAAHAGRGITDADFDRIVHHLIDSLTALDLSPDLVDQVIAAVAPLRPQIVEH